MAYRIIQERCIGCGACAWVCLFDVPTPTDGDAKTYAIEKEKCLGCGQCANVCPNGAIEACDDHRTIRKVTIDPDKCIGCSLCARTCPAGAPHGEVRKPFAIDQEKCFRCGACTVRCRPGAVCVEYAADP